MKLELVGRISGSHRRSTEYVYREDVYCNQVQFY